MSIAGIVAEFNPLHNGHKYLIDCAKSDGHDVFCVISGNFVQRGDSAIIDKFQRAKQALLSGADLIAELPCPWSMSTAQNFAYGAVSQLNALGVDILYFGSETGNTALLEHIADILSSKDFCDRLKYNLKSGKTFAAIREELLLKFEPFASGILKNPNDTLAIEYICAAKIINKRIKFKAIKRIGALHNDNVEGDLYSSASLIREHLLSGDFQYSKRYMPKEAATIIADCDLSDINRLELSILAKLRSLSIDDLRMLPDISEGIENLLYSSIKTASSLNELYSLIKSKRYTHARIRRLVLSAFLGIDNSFFKKEPPYVRILGFKGNAIANLPIEWTKPIVTRISEIKELDNFSQKVFETECRATDLYSLSFIEIKNSGAELTTPLVKI